MGLAAIGFRFVLGAVFLLAGLAKLPRPQEFEHVVRAYDVLPSSWAAPVARGLPAVEVAVGVLFFVGLGTRLAALVTMLTLSAFSVAVAINLARGRELDCGCFAVGAPQRITWTLVARNAALIAMGAVVLANSTEALSLDGLVWGTRAAASDSDATGLLFAAVAGVLALTLIAELWPLRRRHQQPLSDSAIVAL